MGQVARRLTVPRQVQEQAERPCMWSTLEIRNTARAASALHMNAGVGGRVESVESTRYTAQWNGACFRVHIG